MSSESRSGRAEAILPVGMTIEVDGGRKILCFRWGDRNHYLHIRDMSMEEAVHLLKMRAYRHWTPPVPPWLRLSADNPRERPYIGEYSLRLHWFDVWSLDLIWRDVAVDTVLVGNRSLGQVISELYSRNQHALFVERLRKK